jgi:hypothetical protein
MEHSTLDMLLIPTLISLGCLWVLAAAWARTEYEKLSYNNGKLLRPQPAISFFMLRGMIALYKVQKEPGVEFK